MIEFELFGLESICLDTHSLLGVRFHSMDDWELAFWVWETCHSMYNEHTSIYFSHVP